MSVWVRHPTYHLISYDELQVCKAMKLFPLVLVLSSGSLRYMAPRERGGGGEISSSVGEVTASVVFPQAVW